MFKTAVLFTLSVVFLAPSAEAFGVDSVPGGWESEVGRQPFFETRSKDNTATGRAGDSGFGVIPGGRPFFLGDISTLSVLNPGSSVIESKMGTSNFIVPLAKTVRRSTTNRRRSGR